MLQIAILYFSGAGSTKNAARQIYGSIQGKCAADLFSVETANGRDLTKYNGMIVGTPVYHAAPAKFILEYFDSVAPLSRPLPAFLFNTHSLWSCNTNRILAKHLLPKHIIPILSREYRSPASDGSLLVPFVQRFFQFEGALNRKIDADCSCFLRLLEAKHWQKAIPRFRVGSILNAPNKLAGQLTTFSIYCHRDKCLTCGKCIAHCPCHAWIKDSSGYPLFLKQSCANCYRCIHHCPAKALSLNKHKPPKKLLSFDGED